MCFPFFGLFSTTATALVGIGWIYDMQSKGEKLLAQSSSGEEYRGAWKVFWFIISPV